MKLELKQAGPPRSDETMPFSVKFNDGATVKDLFDEVLVNRSNEWGYIRIRDGNKWSSYEYEYRWGKLLKTPSSDIMSQKITRITADGGWSRMDYYVTATEIDNIKEGSK